MPLGLNIYVHDGILQVEHIFPQLNLLLERLQQRFSDLQGLLHAHLLLGTQRPTVIATTTTTAPIKVIAHIATIQAIVAGHHERRVHARIQVAHLGLEVILLLLQGRDLLRQLLDDLLILTDVVGDVDHVASELGADVFGAVGVGQRVARLLEVNRGRADVGDHHRLRVAAQRVLEYARKLAVTIVDILGAAFLTFFFFFIFLSL
jgi:hypothetical protein